MVPAHPGRATGEPSAALQGERGQAHHPGQSNSTTLRATTLRAETCGFRAEGGGQGMGLDVAESGAVAGARKAIWGSGGEEGEHHFQGPFTTLAGSSPSPSSAAKASVTRWIHVLDRFPAAKGGLGDTGQQGALAAALGVGGAAHRSKLLSSFSAFRAAIW